MMFTKETLRRALRTFLQVAISYIVTNLCVVDFNSDSKVLKSTLVGLIVSAGAAGLAAVMNLEKKPVETIEPTEESTEEVTE